MIKPLTITQGIIRDSEIDGIPVKIAIVQPKGLPNVRTLQRMKEVIGITNHNTANIAPTAGDEAHARYLQNVENADSSYISVHLFVDDDSITQCVPLDEMCYHAGDGNGNGNRKTIAIEICENRNYTKAEENAQKLNAALLLTYPNLKIFKHQDWSGKFCPRRILSRPNGWAEFTAGIAKLVEDAKKVENVVKVNYNGQMYELTGQVIDNRNYVGIRELAEKVFSKVVEWDNKNKVVIIMDKKG